MNHHLPDHFSRYFLLVTLVLVLGIGLVVLQSAVTHPGLKQADAGVLYASYIHQVDFTIPYLAGVFPLLFLANAGVALFILLVPLYWAGIWWIRRDLLEIVVRFMRGTVFILVLALGHNSFAYAYSSYRELPFSIVITSYYPHGIFEMLAFILAGTFSLTCIDALGAHLRTLPESPAPHPGDIPLFVLNRVGLVFLGIAALLAIAAAIECWVTPLMVRFAFETVLMNGNT